MQSQKELADRLQHVLEWCRQAGNKTKSSSSNIPIESKVTKTNYLGCILIWRKLTILCESQVFQFLDTDNRVRVTYVRNAGLTSSVRTRRHLHPEFNIFDRNTDPALDELTELAAVLCGADYAYIGWMDFNRLWFKARFGFKAIEQARPLRRANG